MRLFTSKNIQSRKSLTRCQITWKTKKCRIKLELDNSGSLNFDLSGSSYRDFAIIFLIDIPGCFITPYSCERFGRKKTVWVNTLFASLSCLAVAFIPSSGSVRFVRLLLAVVAKCLISIGNQFQTITNPVPTQLLCTFQQHDGGGPWTPILKEKGR